MITTEVGFACLLDGVNSQCESSGNKSTGERPLKDPVDAEPNASGDPSPGEANEDRTEWENDKEGYRHNYAVCHEHPLGAGEGHIIIIAVATVATVTTACSSVTRSRVTRDSELHSPHIVVLVEGTART